MKKVRLFWGFGILLSVLLLAAPAMSEPKVVNAPAMGPPTTKVTVTGTGFGAYEAVDVFFDLTDMFLAVTDNAGKFTANIKVPAAEAGTHWITAIARYTNWAAQKPFLVRTNWPQFRYISRHTGYNSYEKLLSTTTVGDLVLAWTASATQGIESSPAVVGGKVYVGSWDGKLYAFNIDTGNPIRGWPVSTGASIVSSPAVVGGRVYVGTGAGEVYAFNANNGAVVAGWPATVSAGINSSPAVVNGKVYVGADNGKLYAFNASTGTQLAGWPFSTGGAITSSPAVANGVVYVGSADNKLYAVDAVTGKKRWDSEDIITDAIEYSSPAVGPNGVIYVGAKDFKLYAFRRSGAKLWDSGATIKALIRSSPAVANSRVYVASQDGKVYAFNANTGVLVPGWPTISIGTIKSSPAVANGVVYVGSLNNSLYAFNAETAAFLWSWELDGAVSYSSAAVADGTVYIGSIGDSDEGRLYAFNLEGPVELAAARARRAPAGPPDPASLVPDYSLKPQE